MKGFREDWKNPHSAPTGKAADEFPYEAVFEHLDGESPDPLPARASEAMRELMTWVVNVHGWPSRMRQLICARAIAMVWATNPAILDGRSLTAISRRFGMSHDVISRAAAEFSRQFGIRNRPQSGHAWNWKPAGANPQLPGPIQNGPGQIKTHAGSPDETNVPKAGVRGGPNTGRAKESFKPRRMRAGPESSPKTHEPK